jgi:hypothetical protein
MYISPSIANTVIDVEEAFALSNKREVAADAPVLAVDNRLYPAFEIFGEKERAKYPWVTLSLGIEADGNEHNLTLRPPEGFALGRPYFNPGHRERARARASQLPGPGFVALKAMIQHDDNRTEFSFDLLGEFSDGQTRSIDLNPLEPASLIIVTTGAMRAGLQAIRDAERALSTTQAE